MRSKTGLILLLLIFFFSDIRSSIAQQPSQCQAVITGMTGDVLIKQANKNEFVKAYWGTQLFQGDKIKTAANSEATLTLSNSSIIKLGSGSDLTISGDMSLSTESSGNVKKISSAMMINISALTSKREPRKETGALAGLRGYEVEQLIEPITPYNTLIKSNRPSFSWITKKSFDNCIVNLYGSKGLVWSKKTSDTSLKYPENEKELAFGESYFWNVEGEDLIDNKKSVNRKFSVLSPEKSKEVEEQESIIKNTFRDESESSSLHSVLGAYYINQGLLQDAINEFQIISNINADAPLPHEILGSLYSDVGNKDKAIEELQKALALAKNNKDK